MDLDYKNALNVWIRFMDMYYGSGLFLQKKSET